MSPLHRWRSIALTISAAHRTPHLLSSCRLSVLHHDEGVWSPRRQARHIRTFCADLAREEQSALAQGLAARTWPQHSSSLVNCHCRVHLSSHVCRVKC
jgi:hypothetical protein